MPARRRVLGRIVDEVVQDSLGEANVCNRGPELGSVDIQVQFSARDKRFPPRGGLMQEVGHVQLPD